ncbi:hypothetical protein D3C75_1381460 [compost metagenome]
MEHIEYQLRVDSVEVQTEATIGVSVEELQTFKGGQDFRAIGFSYTLPLTH